MTQTKLKDFITEQQRTKKILRTWWRSVRWVWLTLRQR